MTRYWPYAVRSSIFCVKLVTDMPWSTCNRFVQKKKGKNVFFLRKRLTIIIDLFEGLWLVGTFSALAPVLGSQQKDWLCHSVPPFMAVSMIPNVWHSSCYYCMRHSWLTKFGAISLNQLVHDYTESSCLLWYAITQGNH